MVNPQFIEETPLTLSEIKEELTKVLKVDEELNYRSNRLKEFLENFPPLPKGKREQLHKKLIDLNIIRLKDTYTVKIIDFLPKDVEELKVILQGYPVSLTKKDQDAIIATVKEFL
ncbi:hypothetical protein HOC13_03390 [Candidatus Woesearchaeota archaeon]|jgi:DNA-directed RNA polymerase subunit F|nr:hypothetical protein [Candidatus Woesearchaeota archaeon]